MFGTIVIALFAFVSGAEGASCGGQTYGYGVRAGSTKHLDKVVSLGVLSLGKELRVDCCGVLDRWVIHVGQIGNVHMQVWRPTDDDGMYRLVGSNFIHLPSADKTLTVPVPQDRRISIRPGDVIGWYTPESAVITYEQSGVETHLLFPGMQDFDLNTILDWGNNAQSADQRIYNVRFIGDDSSPPYFADVEPAYEMSSATPVGGFVLQYTPADPDLGDLTDYLVSILDLSEFFTVDVQKNYVVARKTPPIGEYQLKMRLHDDCGIAGPETVFNIIVVDKPYTGPMPSKKNPMESESMFRYGWIVGVVVGVLLLVALVIGIGVLGYCGVFQKTSKTKPLKA